MWRRHSLRARLCALLSTDDLCPGSKAWLVDKVHTLEAVAVVGLVVGGLGAAAGTVVLLVVRPEGKERRATPGGVDWNAGVGMG